MFSKRIWTIVSLLTVLVFALSACAKPEPVAPVVTEAPVMTEAPVVTEAPVMTEAPVETSGYWFAPRWSCQRRGLEPGSLR